MYMTPPPEPEPGTVVLVVDPAAGVVVVVAVHAERPSRLQAGMKAFLQAGFD
jgi:hypothetical protein